MDKNKIAIVGDIHGCFEETTDLLRLMVEKPDIREVIFLGDILDKGPDGPKVLDLIKTMSIEAPIKVSIVEGNHEAVNFKYWDKAESQNKERFNHKDSEGMESNYLNIPSNTKNWLKRKVVPYILRPDHNIVIIHGGILPKIDSLFANMDELSRKTKSRILRGRYLRYVNKEGDMVRTGEENKGAGDRFWAEIYDGRFGHCYFGHNPFPQELPKKFKYATGLDLGAVHGGYLAAAIVGVDEPTQYITTKAHKEYSPWKIFD